MSKPAIFLGAPIALFALLFWAGCSASSTPEPSVAAPRAVAVAPLQSEQPRLTSDLPAELSAYQDVNLQARVPGFIRTLYVDRGSRVHAGELLAQLDAPDLIARRSQAEHQVSAARGLELEAAAALQRDQVTLQRLQGAAKAEPGAVAGNDLQVAEQTVAADRAEVESRQAAEAAANEALKSQTALTGYLRVVAPFSGMVVRRSSSPGALAGPSAPALFELQQLDPLRLVVDVPEDQTSGIDIGTRLPFTVSSQPGKTFTGVVARISHSVRDQSRTMPVELDVANPGLALAPGMFANVRWSFQRTQPSWFAPATAVVRDSQRTFVEVLGANHRVRWVDVTTGFNNGDSIEVFGDLHAGDRIVVNGNDEIHDGDPVQPYFQR